MQTKTSCLETFSTYIEKILEHNASGSGIDEEESSDLFYIANECDPDTVGSDAIQFAYEQITGISNPELGELKDQRPVIPGRIVTRYLKEDPVFESPGYLSRTEENLCIDFDTYRHEALCEGEEDVVRLESHPIRWRDNGLHLGFRSIAEDWALMDEGTSWRILRTGGENSTHEGLAILRKNMPHQFIVAKGMSRILDSAKSPWELQNQAYTILDILIQTKEISRTSARQYAHLLTSMVGQEFDSKIKDGVYQERFRLDYSQTLTDFWSKTREADEIAMSGFREYAGSGWGLLNQVILGFSALPAVVVGGKILLGALGVTATATAPAWLPWAIGAAVVSGGIYGGIYLFHRIRSAKIMEEQHSQFVKRYQTPVPERNGMKREMEEPFHDSRR